VSIDDVEDISEYDGIIIGTSVRADRPLANVRDFFSRYRRFLEKKKTAFFVVCLSANCAERREKVKTDYIQNFLTTYPDIKPISIEAFGGKIDFDKLNPVMQSLMRRVLEKTGLPTQGSIDTRDWDFIESWAEHLKHKLKAA
jgi:menaquinone-dependent protoporphyrinogen IX oxidase